jgi:hypothetical protein
LDFRNNFGRSAPVIDQNLVAGLADPGAVLLQARQHGLVAIIHHGPAMPGDVAGAGVVPRLLLGRSRRNQKTGQSKRNDQKKSGHLVRSSYALMNGIEFAQLDGVIVSTAILVSAATLGLTDLKKISWRNRALLARR